jgi:hypothetical protein
MTFHHHQVVAMALAQLLPRATSAAKEISARGLLLSNQTHRSSSVGEARLIRKPNSTGSFLSYLGHCLMENRHGLVVATEMTPSRWLR